MEDRHGDILKHVIRELKNLRAEVRKYKLIDETRRLNHEYAKTVLLGAEGKLPLYDIESLKNEK
mgnify:FL=1